MKFNLFSAIVAAILFLIPKEGFGQAPTLGAAAKFVLFTTIGPVTNSGIPYLSHITGYVGTNAGSTTGFGNVDGQIHDGGDTTIACATDVMLLFGQLTAASTTISPTSTLLGNGDTLVAGVYQYPLLSAASLNLNLILDGEGDPNALFIIRIDGAFSINPGAKVILANGALACNVFWLVEGMIGMGAGATMRGTMLAHNGQIALGALDTVEGRVFSINGEILTNSLMAHVPLGCGSPYLTGPAAPPLGSAAAFGVFTSIGPVTSTPITYVIGDVGSNSALPTGFDPANVTGEIRGPGTITGDAASDLTIAYNYLNALHTDVELTAPALFGHDLVLTPHTYHMAAAPIMLIGNVYLNGQGNPNAVFVINMNGAFITSTNSKIILMNGTQAKNVYWKIDGATHIYDYSVFNGTIIGAGAIDISTGDTLNGRALTIDGAVAINGSYINSIQQPCTASPITGIMQVCPGGTTTLSNVDTGGVWHSGNLAVAEIDSVSGVVTGITPGTSIITFRSGISCETTDTVTVNALPFAGTITGTATVCPTTTTTLNNTTADGVWTSVNMTTATIGSTSGVVTGLTPGTTTISYTVTNSCGTAAATEIVTVNPSPDAGTITGTATVCPGNTTTLSNTVPDGIWTSTNMTTATIGSASGIVTGMAIGTTTISYTVTNICGIAAATRIVTVNVLPDAGAITGTATVCPTATTTLSNTATSGVWTSVNTAAATIGSASGIVTGVAAGTTTISYTVTSSCGTAAATRIVTVNPAADAGTITGTATVCPTNTTTLSNTATSGVWTSTNTAAATIGSTSGVVTGIAAGTTTISYTVTNGCGTVAATRIVTVSPVPVAGTITGTATVCPTATTTLSNTATSGVWTSVNTATATIGSASGIVTGVAAGTTTISYTVTNSCGTAAATRIVSVNPVADAGTITGTATVCPTNTTTLSNTATSGIWTSTNTAVATIGSTSGVVTGIAAGTTTISYTVTNGCGTVAATRIVTVNPTPNAGIITGTATVCPANTTTLSNTATGGLWTSVTTATATIGSASGIVTGVAAGTSTISYTVTNSCGTVAATRIVTVNPAPDAGSITGASSVCVSATIALSNTSTTGIWSSSNTNTTVSSSGTVTGIAAGTSIISYTANNSCGTATATKFLVINPLPNAGSITGASSVCVGAISTLANTITGGTWSSSNSRATVSAGTVIGVMPGIDTIIYAVSNMCGSATTIKIITVNSLPLVPVITTQSPSNVCAGTMYQNFGTTTPASAGTVYNWSAVNAIVWAQGTAHNNALVSFLTPGNAYVMLKATISATGCSSQSTITVTVNANVAQTDYVSYFGNHFVCTPNGLNAYQWGYDDRLTLDSTILVGEINQDYVNASPDFGNKHYWVMTTSGGCHQKTYYRTPLAIQATGGIAANVKVYPNPATTEVNIEIDAVTVEKTVVEIWNVMGQKTNTTSTTDNKATINIANLPAGIYIISCTIEGNRISNTRFIKN